MNVGVAQASALAQDATVTTFQTVYPSADIQITGWTTNTGATTNLWQAVDESVLDTADYVTAVLV
jgi:hypothetical protein